MNTKGADDSDMNNDNLIMVVAIAAKPQQNKQIPNTLDETLKNTTKPELPTFNAFLMQRAPTPTVLGPHPQ